MVRQSFVRFFVSLALLACASAFAQANVRTGDTSGGPTFTRPLADLSDLSAVGTAVAYDAFSFSVTAAGDYTFRNLTLGRSDPWDGFLILYVDAFDPAAALANAVVANDDFNNNLRLSGFEATLATGVAYTLVTTGFSNDDAGRFVGLIRGPGEITSPIPETGTLAMLLAGLGTLAWVARRRRAG